GRCCMTVVLDWKNASDREATIQRAVQALAEGGLVAFPTETVYGLAATALLPEAVERLRQGKGRPADKPLALAIRGYREVADWVPSISPLGERLARRSWPGPITLVFAQDPATGLSGELDESVRRLISPGGTLGL